LSTHKPGYAFEGVIDGVPLDVLIKFGSTAGSYTLLAEGRGANLKGTTNPVTVTLSIGNNTGTTKIHAHPKSPEGGRDGIAVWRARRPCRIDSAS
jgi:hypothetical protein